MKFAAGGYIKQPTLLTEVFLELRVECQVWLIHSSSLGIFSEYSFSQRTASVSGLMFFCCASELSVSQTSRGTGNVTRITGAGFRPAPCRAPPQLRVFDSIVLFKVFNAVKSTWQIVRTT